MDSNDRTVRRLTALERSASTARVLNLLSASRRFQEDPTLAEAPFFQNALLNQSLIVKHRLRPHEYEDFDNPPPTATKILLPIDVNDLKAGAKTLFVGQRGFDEQARFVFGDDLKVGSRDRQTLDIVAELPSLDPFLLKEQLRANGIEPARPYFAISDADVQRMFEFVRGEILALVVMSAGEGAAGGAKAYAFRLVDKLLSSGADSGFEPLRETLKLSEQAYRDGVFSWRGFLYYKWVLASIASELEVVLQEMVGIQGRGPRSPEASDYLPKGRARILESLKTTQFNVRALLGVYDKAYAALTRDGQPGHFRDFLLQAPEMFIKLGEQLGALQHVASFWRYRFPHGKPQRIAPDELMDLLLDFEDSLSFGEAQLAAA